MLLSLKDKAYSIIKDKIIRCEYLPGEVLIESEIMEAVGASRTPIREALNKLEHERLVRIVAKRGVFVSEISVSTVYDVYDVRELVEPYLLERYASLIPPEKIECLFAEFERLDKEEFDSYDEFYAFDNELHQLIAGYSNNTYLEVMMEQIYGQNERIRFLAGQDSRQRLKASQDEHKEILDAIWKKDYTGGANAMRQHLQIAREAALEAIMKKNRTSFGL